MINLEELNNIYQKEKHNLIKEYLKINENQRNKDVVKNAVQYLKYKNEEFKDLDDVEVEMTLYYLYKFANE